MIHMRMESKPLKMEQRLRMPILYLEGQESSHDNMTRLSQLSVKSLLTFKSRLGLDPQSIRPVKRYHRLRKRFSRIRPPHRLQVLELLARGFPPLTVPEILGAASGANQDLDLFLLRRRDRMPANLHVTQTCLHSGALILRCVRESNAFVTTALIPLGQLLIRSTSVIFLGARTAGEQLASIIGLLLELGAPRTGDWEVMKVCQAQCPAHCLCY